MEDALTLTYWLFQPQAWIIAGIILIIADIVLGVNFFILPFGVAALLMSLGIVLDQNLYLGDVVFLQTWKTVLIVYSAMSVACIFLIRLVFQKKLKERKDINEY